MLYSLAMLLLFLVSSVPVAEAQEPTGYWLYVDGVWKGGFKRRDECVATAARTPDKAYECRPIYVGSVAPGSQLSSQSPDSRYTWDSAVDICRRSARTRDRYFDAYVKGPGSAETVGTAQARFEFRKCMSELGYPLE